MMCWGVASNASAKTIYLNTGGASLWEVDGADKFAVWHWQGTAQGAWSAWMTRIEGSIWKTDIADNSDRVIFVRSDKTATTPDWNKQWNKTEDLTIPAGKDLYTITGWGEDDGDWSTYGQVTPTVTPTEFETAVPSQCEDIMLQAFYWDSYADKGFGDTKWQTLTNQVSDIAQSFSLVWLPPSAAPGPGGMYIPSCYSTQSSNLFGKKAYLQSLITSLHNAGVRVLADIVINHCGNKGTTCDFSALDFGSYGQFEPQENWMTSNDEGVTKYGCQGGDHADDGQHDANYGSARDWDHKNTNVQAMCRAYLQWMKSDMQYDGFRFDYSGGYHVSHTADYLTASKPYFSVMEYWDGNVANLRARIDDASKKTLAFDFPNRYSAFKNGISAGDYSKCKSSGLRGQGYAKYAVTFIDNHDTFQRTNTESDIANSTNGGSINNKSLILQCNAYILSLPGVPCVFWPHWVKYKSDINKMIAARRAAGIHSESSMTENAGTNWYEATITGKHGEVILYLGSSASKAAPQGYTTAVKGDKYAMYYISYQTPVEEVIAQVATIDWTRPVYSITGQQVSASYRGVVIQDGHKFIR